MRLLGTKTEKSHSFILLFIKPLSQLIISLLLKLWCKGKNFYDKGQGTNAEPFTGTRARRLGHSCSIEAIVP